MDSRHLVKVESAIKDGDVVLLKDLLSETYQSGSGYWNASLLQDVYDQDCQRVSRLGRAQRSPTIFELN